MPRNSPDVRPDVGAIFFSGATATRFSSRALADAGVAAYGGNFEFVPSALLSSDPPKARHAARWLQKNSGEPVHIFAHSSGGAQLRRALRQAGKVDISRMTVIAIDNPRGPLNLARGLQMINGSKTAAIDSVIAFHPDPRTMSLGEATDGLRQVFPMRQEVDILETIDYQTGIPVDYSTDQTREVVAETDGKIAAALSDRHLPAAQHLPSPAALYLDRARLLRDDTQLLYHGDHSSLRPPDESKGEIKGKNSLRAGRESLRLLPAVASGAGWRVMERLARQEGGPRVVVAIPEWGPFVPSQVADAIFPEVSEIGENVVFLRGLSHSGIAFQPQVIGELKNYIDRTVA